MQLCAEICIFQGEFAVVSLFYNFNKYTIKTNLKIFSILCLFHVVLFVRFFELLWRTFLSALIEPRNLFLLTVKLYLR